MSTIKEAWDAIRQGDRLKAQEIAAHILKNDPTNADGWMVLGESVTGERKALFYRKALQLNPDLDAAKQRLIEIEQNQLLGISPDETMIDPFPMMTGEPEVPEGVILDAPTQPLAQRIAADNKQTGALKTKTESTAAMEARAKSSANAPAQPNIDVDSTENRSGGIDVYTILLFFIALCIAIVIYLIAINFPTLS